MNKTTEKLTEDKTKIEIEIPEINKNIKVLKYTLLPLEFFQLKIIFTVQTPLSTGFFYNCNLLEAFDNSAITMIKDFKLKYKYGKINRMSWKRMDAKMFNYMKLVHSTSSEKYREIEKKLREKEIYFPSYKKILSTLERLESWNFLTRRYEEGTKEKFYWIINPQFYHKFGSEFEAMLEKDNKK